MVFNGLQLRILFRNTFCFALDPLISNFDDFLREFEYGNIWIYWEIRNVEILFLSRYCDRRRTC